MIQSFSAEIIVIIEIFSIFNSQYNLTQHFDFLQLLLYYDIPTSQHLYELTNNPDFFNYFTPDSVSLTLFTRQ